MIKTPYGLEKMEEIQQKVFPNIPPMVKRNIINAQDFMIAVNMEVNWMNTVIVIKNVGTNFCLV